MVYCHHQEFIAAALLPLTAITAPKVVEALEGASQLLTIKMIWTALQQLILVVVVAEMEGQWMT